MIDPSANQYDQEIVLSEDGNPWSVENMLTGKIKEKFAEIPAQYFGMHEKHLEAIAKPSELDDMLRESFWDEYFACIDAKKTIDIKRVYARLCTRDYFYKTIVEVPPKFAYVLRPPLQYSYRMRSLLNLGHKRLRQVLEMPLKDGKNVANIKLISEIVKIVQMLENRVHGSVVQKIDVKQQSKNLNMNIEQRVGNSPSQANELEKIQNEINQIERMQALPTAQPDIIDAISVDVNVEHQPARPIKAETGPTS